ncbi:MAG: Rrf2 family transcriptional regulator [Flavobacteriales bacterium]
MFSKTCEYAFRAAVVVALASKNGERLTLTDIAERTGAPKAFTAKVLQALARGGIVNSQRGPHGGFDLPPLHAKKVNLRMIMDAIGEEAFHTGCVMGLKECNAKDPCPLHAQITRVKEEMHRVLENTDVLSLAEGLNNGTTRLKL